MIRILHVDDSEGDHELVEFNLLRLSGDLQIHWAESAQLAMKMLAGEDYDCILSDYQMPEMDGMKFLKALRKDGNETPFIFLTGQGNEEIAAEALRSGANDYFTKDAGFALYHRLLNSVQNLSEKTKMREKRREADEKVRHLNLILRAIRNINRLFTKEQDLDRILSGSCECLTETRGYPCAWIALLDEKENIVKFARSGLPDGFALFENSVSAGEVPPCVREALDPPGVVVIEDTKKSCSDYAGFGDGESRGVIAVRLEHAGIVFGLLCVSLPRAMAVDDEELELLQEVGEDLALALYKKKLEESRKRAEEALLSSREMFYRAFHSAPLLMTISAVEDGTYIDVNEFFVSTTGYSKEESIGTTSVDLGLISKADRETLRRELLEKGRVRGMELNLRKKSGDTLICSYSGELITVEGSQRLLSIAVDITERKQAEDQHKIIIELLERRTRKLEAAEEVRQAGKSCKIY